MTPKGLKPVNHPVEQPIKFDLMNDLTMPATLLACAEEAIE
jgi:hypothetical protein